MSFSFIAQRRLACGLLLLVLAGCGTSTPPADTQAEVPASATSDRDTAAETDTPPGQVDPELNDVPAASQSAPTGSEANRDMPPDAVAVAPSSIPVSDGIRILRCDTTGGLVDDPNGPLNVRSEPDTEADNIVDTLDDGAYVSIVGEQDNWWQIDAPEEGWVSKNLVDTSCTAKEARIEFPPNTTSITISDRIVGPGSHRYELSARAGQQISIEALTDRTPIPFIHDPDDRDITGGGSYTNDENWAGELPEDGTYTLIFDSHLRGYTYELMLSVE